MKNILILLVMLGCTMSVWGNLPTDSLDVTTAQDRSTAFRARQLIAPGALIAVGAVGLSKGWVRNFKEDVRDGMNNIRGKYIKADEYLQFLPLAAGVGLGALGVKARHPLRERVAVAVTGTAVAEILAQGTKRIVRETRPNGEDRHSFPSGHTTLAFLGAEIVRTEYGWGYGSAAYVVATGVGFLRMYNNKHWINDVIAGAGYGILSARIAYWLLPVERKWFGWDKPHRPALTAVPLYLPEQKGFGVALTLNLP